MWRKYFQDRGDTARDTVIIPDSAHGTNPASVRLAGFKVVEVPSGPDGRVDVEALKGLLGPHVVGLMITNPNTLGVFEKHIEEITEAGARRRRPSRTATARTSTRSSDGRVRATWASTSSTSTCTRRSRRRTAAADRGPGRSAWTNCSRRTCPCRGCVRNEDGTFDWRHDEPLSIGPVHSLRRELRRGRPRVHLPASARPRGPARSAAWPSSTRTT